MKHLTYTKATERLNEIMQLIESEQLDIDSLTATLKEANQLLAFCKDRLYQVEQEVKEIYSSSDKETPSTSPQGNDEK